MWQLNPAEEFARRQARYAKKRPRELRAVLDNLDTYFQTLQDGVQPLQVKHGFMHNEGQGVVAIDQKGGGPSLAQTRLYIYPEVETETLHIITLGDKRTQQDDIKTCRNFVAVLDTTKHEKDD